MKSRFLRNRYCISATATFARNRRWICGFPERYVFSLNPVVRRRFRRFFKRRVLPFLPMRVGRARGLFRRAKPGVFIKVTDWLENREIVEKNVRRLRLGVRAAPGER
jgi:hypothetical protein